MVDGGTPSPSSEKSNLSELFARTTIGGIVTSLKKNMLEAADELSDKGMEAFRERDYTNAVECLRDSLANRVMLYGESHMNCGRAYSKYGIALLFKVTAPALRAEPASEHSSDQSLSQEAADEVSSVTHEVEIHDKIDTRKVLENAGTPHDLIEGFDMLFIASQLSKSPSDPMVRDVGILSELATIVFSFEGHIHNSLLLSLEAFSILKSMAQPDAILFTALGVSICEMLAQSHEPQTTIPCCEKAISICKSFVEVVTADVNSSLGNKTIESLHEVSQLLEMELRRLQQLGNETVSMPPVNKHQHRTDSGAGNSDPSDA